MSDWRQRFKSRWFVDFEFRQDANHRPLPISMAAYDEVSETRIFLRRDELLKLTTAPFGTGPDDLMLAFASDAELSCFAVLRWPFPVNVLDVYVETIAAINGNTDIWPGKGRPGLLDALQLHGLEGISKTDKDHWRDVILDHEDYTEDQWQGIEAYNFSDDDETAALLAVTWQAIDLPRALMRGRSMGAFARVTGLPIDVAYFRDLEAAFDNTKRHYIRELDTLHLYDDIQFREERLWALVEARGWDWPRTPTGRYKLAVDTFGKQAPRYPELQQTARLRDQIAELRLNQFANTIGLDGFSRVPLKPFWTKTGRNQPGSKGRPGHPEEAKMFLLGLPTWLHGLIKPPPGWAIFELDFKAEEIGLVAARSGDPAMIADYLDEPYIKFGERSGLLPTDATEQVRSEIRNLCKPVVLGQLYGMTAYGVAHKTGKSLLWARDVIAHHRHAYPVFHQWRGDVVAQARFDELIVSPFGWPMAVTAKTSNRTLMNYLAQTSGSDLLRLTMIAATETGIQIAATAHDAIWAMAPLDELDDTIARLTEIMTKASVLVTGGLPIGVKLAAVVRWPNCLGDVRKDGDKGQAMWREIKELVYGELRQRAGA